MTCMLNRKDVCKEGACNLNTLVCGVRNIYVSFHLQRNWFADVTGGIPNIPIFLDMQGIESWQVLLSFSATSAKVLVQLCPLTSDSYILNCCKADSHRLGISTRPSNAPALQTGLSL